MNHETEFTQVVWSVSFYNNLPKNNHKHVHLYSVYVAHRMNHENVFHNCTMSFFALRLYKNMNHNHEFHCVISSLFTWNFEEHGSRSWFSQWYNRFLHDILNRSCSISSITISEKKTNDEHETDHTHDFSQWYNQFFPDGVTQKQIPIMSFHYCT